MRPSCGDLTGGSSRIGIDWLPCAVLGELLAELLPPAETLALFGSEETVDDPVDVGTGPESNADKLGLVLALKGSRFFPSDAADGDTESALAGGDRVDSGWSCCCTGANCGPGCCTPLGCACLGSEDVMASLAWS